MHLLHGTLVMHGGRCVSVRKVAVQDAADAGAASSPRSPAASAAAAGESGGCSGIHLEEVDPTGLKHTLHVLRCQAAAPRQQTEAPREEVC